MEWFFKDANLLRTLESFNLPSLVVHFSKDARKVWLFLHNFYKFTLTLRKFFYKKVKINAAIKINSNYQAKQSYQCKNVMIWHKHDSI